MRPFLTNAGSFILIWHEPFFFIAYTLVHSHHVFTHTVGAHARRFAFVDVYGKVFDSVPA